MILPDFVIPSKSKTVCFYTGMDDPNRCADKKHFDQYPNKIVYQYNSRGFRDHEWPDDVVNSIWCFGDSYTVGTGCAFENTWPQLLKQKSLINTINISMDGASNNWIARKAIDVLDTIQPKVLILHWSFINRREESLYKIKQQFWQNFYNNIKDKTWPECPDLRDFALLPIGLQQEINSNPDQSWRNVADDNRLIHFLPKASIEQDIDNTVNCLLEVEQHAGQSKIIHSFIPECMDMSQIDLFVDKLNCVSNTVIPFFPKLDYARDGLHYDRKTAEFFVDQLLINLQ